MSVFMRPARDACLTTLLLCGLIAAGCSEDAEKSADPQDQSAQGNDADDDTAGSAAASAPDKPAPLYDNAAFTGPWAPKKVYTLADKPTRRGMLDLRGLIHAHSPYSHDACDGEGFDKAGNMNLPCLQDFRRDICTVGHDFAFITDHPSHFREHEFPGVLLYDGVLLPGSATKDQLVVRGGKQVANRMACEDGRRVLLMAGSETSQSMPVGLEGHIGDMAARKKLYSTMDAPTFEALKKGGAVVLFAHTEDHTISDLVDLPLDGFEMYNLHQNMMSRMKDAAKLAATLLDDTKEHPNPDLILLGLVYEDPDYLTRWGTALATGKHRVTTMGTDCHRNTLPLLLGDGERVDSYRRMMIWFSNHLLVKPDKDGKWDDRHLKEALKKGRLYGVFEVLGYPDGFDYVATEGVATAGDKTVEMGDTVSIKAGATLHVRIPTLMGLGDKAEKPVIRARLVRARKDGWDEIAAGADDLHVKPDQPGAYRAEIRIKPKHLRGHLAWMKDVADQEFVWIYGNAVYVTE